MKKYVFKPYSDLYPSLFRNEKRRIQSLVFPEVLIEHVGSTAIVGLGGKGIIDIAIVVQRADMEEVKEVLQSLGYEFREAFSTPDRFFFRMDLPDPEEESRMYHVHVICPNSREWKELVEFREYLLNNPQEREAYQLLKQRAVLEADNDGKKYKQIKAPVFEKFRLLQEKNSLGQVERFWEGNVVEALAFLKKHENFSLFLLGNLEAYGYQLSSSPNSGNFRLIRCDGSVVAVFCLTRRGTIIVHSTLEDDWIYETIVEECRDEGIPIVGLLGEWDFCEKFWSVLKEKQWIQKELFSAREVLYVVDVRSQLFSGHNNVRCLCAEDYDQWEYNRLSYLEETGLPKDLSLEQLRALFLEKVTRKTSWGFFLEGKLVSMVELTAQAQDLAQVGGMYTQPAHRNKGYAKAVMEVLMREAKEVHAIRKLVLFTGEINCSARKLYESLRFYPVGYYALLFGTGN